MMATVQVQYCQALSEKLLYAVDHTTKYVGLNNPGLVTVGAFDSVMIADILLLQTSFSLLYLTGMLLQK